MKRGLSAFCLIVFFAALKADAQEKVDNAVMAKIRAEGLQHSQVMEVFDHLVNVIGPRLTASPAYKTAVDWTRDRLLSMGFDNVHLEPWEFGRGWQLEHLSVRMISFETIALPRAATSGVNRRLPRLPGRR